MAGQLTNIENYNLLKIVLLVDIVLADRRFIIN
jgi:hypothetical protein